MKQKLLFAAMFIIGALGQLRAQTDVTSFYLTNPSFETGDMTGWSAFGANNNDTPVPTAALVSDKPLANASGDYVCNFQWWCWSANATVNGISQTISQLPAGTYKFTAVVGAPNGWSVKLYANDENASATMTSDYEGQELSVTVTLADASDVTVKAIVIAPANAWEECNMRVDNFKLYKSVTIDTDLTDKFPIDWQGWTGATGYVGWAAPQVTTNDGRDTPACERFDGSAATTGKVFMRTLTGLANGTYRIELYGAAASTKGRDTGIDSEMTSADEGDETAVYLYATTASGTVKQYIPVHWATDFNESGIATAVLNDVVVTDGTVEIGMYGEKEFTNWHVVQIKGVTATVDAASLLAAAVSEASALEGTIPNDIWSDLEAVITANNQPYLTGAEYLTAISTINDAKVTAEVAANKTMIADNKGDITSLINGTFDANAEGWSGYTGYCANQSWTNRSWRGDVQSGWIERNADGTMTAIINNMPAGTYKVVAAARSYAGGKIKAQVAGGEYGAEVTGSGDTAPADGTMEINTNGVEMPYSRLGGFTTVTEGHNWHWISATGTLAADGDLVLNFTTTGSGWMAIDDVHLYCTNLDGTSYTTTLNGISANADVANTGNGSVVTCDIKVTNPNVVFKSNSGTAITTAAGQSLNNCLYNTTAWYMTKMVLYDGYAFEDYRVSHGGYQYFAQADGDNSCTLYRNIPANTWCTLMVPFWPLTSLTMKYPSEYNDGTGVLTFADLSNTTGCWNNKPMLIKSTSALTAITGKRAGTGASASGVTYGDNKVEAGTVTMNGTYSAIDAVPNDSYVVAHVNDADALYKVNSTVSLAPFRAYFSVGGGAGVKANVIALNFDELPTAIESISGAEFTVKGAQIYNLAGQRLNKMQRGVNIVNGKKVLVK